MFTAATLEKVVNLSRAEHDSFQPRVNDGRADGEASTVSQCFSNSDFTLLFCDLYCHLCQFKVLNNLCIMGFVHGSIILASLEKNEMIANIKAHSDKVTSITIWRTYILSTSLDGFVRYFNLADCTTKSLNAEEQLSCADHDDEGVLYVGTKSGSIYKFNILAMTIITPFIQVSRYPIDEIKLMPKEEEYRRKLLIFSEGKWSLRECSSGEKLMAFEIPSTIYLDYCPRKKLFMGLTKNTFYTADTQKEGKGFPEVHPLPGIVTSSLLFENILIIGFRNGDINLYKENFEQCGLIRGIANDYVSHIARWKENVVCYFAEVKCIGWARLSTSTNL